MIPAATALALMELTTLALKQVPAAVAAYEATRSDLERMIAQGRGPTIAELEVWTRRIRRANRELRAPFPDDPAPDAVDGRNDPDTPDHPDDPETVRKRPEAV